MKVGVLILNFGEPENSTLEEVIPFLERIFARNSSLESNKGKSRARKLAEARAPGLIEEYEEIGGSPMIRQARRQARMVERILRRRDVDVRCYSGMQFTEPFVGADSYQEMTDDVGLCYLLYGYKYNWRVGAYIPPRDSLTRYVSPLL